MEDADKKAIIAKILPSLNAEDIDNFLPLLEERHAAGGTILVSQGDTDRDLYLLLNGSYSAFYKIRVNLTAVATNVGNWPGPSLLGDVNLVLDNTRTATVVAREACDYLYLSKDSFDQISEKFPSIAIKILTASAAIINGRFESMRKTMYSSIIHDSPTIPVGITRLGRLLGNWSRVPDEISKKLFADYEGENFNS
jgi:CRP-like cAMP-binding protein